MDHFEVVTARFLEVVFFVFVVGLFDVQKELVVVVQPLHENFARKAMLPGHAYSASFEWMILRSLYRIESSFVRVFM